MQDELTKMQDELKMRYPTRTPELARYSLAMAWRDFRCKRIDGATFSAVVNQCALAIRRADESIITVEKLSKRYSIGHRLVSRTRVSVKC